MSSACVSWRETGVTLPSFLSVGRDVPRPAGFCFSARRKRRDGVPLVVCSPSSHSQMKPRRSPASPRSLAFFRGDAGKFQNGQVLMRLRSARQQPRRDAWLSVCRRGVRLSVCWGFFALWFCVLETRRIRFQVRGWG